MPKKLKTVSLLTKQNELSVKSIVKRFKAFKLILFCLKKVEKKLKRVLLLTKRNKLSAQLIAKLLKVLSLSIFLVKKSAEDIENG